MKADKYELCTVVPISRMAGKLDLFKSWVLKAQSYSIFIVIVHDWRDQDTELELITFLSTIDPECFIFLSSKYGSPGSARNAGMRNIKGQWLSFWDSDDIPELENVMKAIENSQDGDEVLIGGFQRIDSKSEALSSNHVGPDWRKSVSSDPGLWRMIFHKEIINQVAFTNLLMAEDQFLLLQYRIFDRRVRIFQDKFYSYQVQQQHQATRKRESLLDLISFLISANLEIADLESPYLFYYQRMFIKQALSAVKHLNLAGKISAVKQVIIFATNHGVMKTLSITLKVINEK